MKHLIIGGMIACGAFAAKAEVIYSPFVNSHYHINFASVFAGAGGPTEIYGAPQGAESAGDVAAAVRLPSYLSSNRIRLAEPGEDGYRLVLVFSPQNGISGERACRGELRGGESGGATKVYGAFCSGDRMVSEATMETAANLASDRDGFRTAMRRMMRVMLPLRSPTDEGAGGCRTPGC